MAGVDQVPGSPFVGLVETGPAARRLELGVRVEEPLPAGGAVVGALAVLVEQLPCEGPLRAALAQHVVLHGGEPGPPLGVCEGRGLVEAGEITHAPIVALPSSRGAPPGPRGSAPLLVLLLVVPASGHGRVALIGLGRAREEALAPLDGF